MDEEFYAPKVTVILPVRNEADCIEECLESILGGDYPAKSLEVIVVDGMSDDGTREILLHRSSLDPRIRVLSNQNRIVSHGMNLGILHSTGEIIIRVDGHASVARDFIRRNLEALKGHPEAWCVGGSIESVNSNYIGKAIAGATSSWVSAGNARFRLGNYEGYVDTIAFGAYRRWVFDRIGLFDEELVRNQDDELNYRILRAGGKIHMSPRIRSRYWARNSIRKLARQYFQYGYWRIRTLQKYGRPATLRQIVPLTFVLLWSLMIAGTAAWPPAGYALAAFACIYALLLAVGVIDVTRKSGLPYGLIAPLIFIIVHFSYGLGGLRGIWTFIILHRGAHSDPQLHTLSR
jgi:glycosyltransferase involved in cell wall biosynthesis